ncbi:MAG: peptidylprolyl isomerase, partial [Flavobacteriales bacterium]
MVISMNSAAAIHYTLRNGAGEILDSSEGKQPLYYLHGHGNLIPGMEAGLLGKKEGETFKILVSPEDGYGLRDEGLV